MKKMAMILSGCGHRDGAEITETVSSIVGLSEAGAHVEFFAPNIEVNSINHFTGEVNPVDKRNLLLESARITRGRSIDLRKLNADDFDALVIVGGVGAATNLSTWGKEGANCSVLHEVSKAIETFYSQRKPIGAICIAPVLIAKVLGKYHVSVTIGEDVETAEEVEKTGAKHVTCGVNNFVVDRDHKIVTTPAYMYDTAPPHEIFKGISGLAKEIVALA